MAFETLEILIEADSAGLQTQMKKAGKSIQSFVSDMNKQEVNWTSILSKSISPAIISGIALMFALAITSALQFQNQMTQTAALSSEAFQDNLGGASKAAIGVSNATGQSAAKVGAAMGRATQALGDYATGMQLASDASSFATVSGLDLGDLIDKLIPIFDKWHVKAGDVDGTMASLTQATKFGKISLYDLLDVLNKTGTAWSDNGVGIGQAAYSLEVLSTQAGMTKDTAIELFEKIATAAQVPADNFGVLTVGFNNMSKILKEGGIPEALEKIAGFIASMGPTTSLILANHLGISPDLADNLVQVKDGFKGVGEQVDIVSSKQVPFAKEISDLTTPMDRLLKAWQSIKNTIMEIIGLPIVNWLTGALTSVDGLLKGAQSFGSEITKGLSSLNDKSGGLLGKAAGFVGSMLAGLPFSGKNDQSVGITSSAEKVGKDTTQTSAGTTNVYNSDHSVNVQISSGAIGGGKGASSQSLDSALYAGQYGYAG